MQGDRIANIAQEHQRAGPLRSPSPRPQHLRRRLQPHHLELDAGWNRQRHRRAREHVAGGFVVRHQDRGGIEGRKPCLQHLSVHEAVVHANHGDAQGRLAQPILRSDSLT